MIKQDYKIIAICIADIDEEYNDSFLRAFSKYAGEYNLKVLYFNSFSSFYQMKKHDIGESNIYRLINYNLIDGLIILTQTIKSNSLIQDLVEAAQYYNIPTMSIDGTLDSCYNINFNFNKAIEQIVEHLITTHHITRFNFIAGIKDSIYSQGRLDAFMSALAKHGISIEEERIGYGGFWGEPTRKVMDDFLASNLPFPEAIVCANDSMAITVVDRLIAAGYRVPEDVLVTGFDGIREALEHNPSITTAQHDIETTVRTTYKTFIDIFEGKKPEQDISIESKVVYGGSCGCVIQPKFYHNELHRALYHEIEGNKVFLHTQIRMTADLTDKNSFQEVFDSIRDYAVNEFSSNRFWLCIVDNFLADEEFSDIIEESGIAQKGYSDKMDMMLYRSQGEWQGMTDFATEQLLPNLTEIFQETDNIIFFPLHVHEQNIGYAALSVDAEPLNINHCYQFFMNVSNALEITKSHLRQQTIIQNLENKYVHDPLTGLFNRRGFYQKVQPVYAECINNQQVFMIMSMDLNGLKVINDTYGHADGDIAISVMAKAILHCSQNSETCSRFGGDEFIVAGRIAGEEEGIAYLSRIREYLSEFNEFSGKPYEVSASMGIVFSIPSNDLTLDQFISQADERMYAEKAKHHLSRKR